MNHEKFFKASEAFETTARLVAGDLRIHPRVAAAALIRAGIELLRESMTETEVIAWMREQIDALEVAEDMGTAEGQH